MLLPLRVLRHRLALSRNSGAALVGILANKLNCLAKHISRIRREPMAKRPKVTTKGLSPAFTALHGIITHLSSPHSKARSSRPTIRITSRLASLVRSPSLSSRPSLSITGQG